MKGRKSNTTRGSGSYAQDPSQQHPKDRATLKKFSKTKTRTYQPKSRSHAQDICDRQAVDKIDLQKDRIRSGAKLVHIPILADNPKTPKPAA